MKLSIAALGLMASEYAVQAAIEKPYDCYREMSTLYGKDAGIKKTDMFVMTGLNAYKAKLAAITGCFDYENNLMTGLFTVWGEWTGTEWTNL